MTIFQKIIDFFNRPWSSVRVPIFRKKWPTDFCILKIENTLISENFTGVHPKNGVIIIFCFEEKTFFEEFFCYLVWSSASRVVVFIRTKSLAISSVARCERIRKMVQPVSSNFSRFDNVTHTAHDPKLFVLEKCSKTGGESWKTLFNWRKIFNCLLEKLKMTRHIRSEKSSYYTPARKKGRAIIRARPSTKYFFVARPVLLTKICRPSSFSLKNYRQA
mgnify:CR=1 FL=1